MQNNNTQPVMKRKHIMKRLLSYIVGRHKALFAVVLVCIFISSCAVVLSSLFLETLIDDYITPFLTESAPNFDGLFSLILRMAVIYAFGTICSFLYNRLMIRISQGTLKEIRDDMFRHMQQLPISYFDTHTHGDIMSHYTNDTDTLRQFISQALPQLISSVISVVVILVAMFANSVPLTLVVLVFAIIMVCTSRKVGGQSAHYFIRQQQSLADVTGFAEETLNGQKVIKVFCHEEQVKARFMKKNDGLYEDAVRANIYGNILMPLMMQIGNLQYVLLALVGGLLALNQIGSVTVGMIIAFLNLSKALCMPISQISQQISLIAMALAGAGRIFMLLDEKVEEDHGTVTLVRAADVEQDTAEKTEKGWFWRCPAEDGTVSYVPLKGDIRFHDVDFGYTAQKTILHKINLFAKPGQKIAFVGATGAGKTTITNLVNRFYDINSGEILYDGIEITKIKKPDLRRSLGVVLQDVHLFTGTIMENIRYGRLDATDEECIAAAMLTNAHDFISRLPDGYQTMLTQDGALLSQGQRQLLSIARAAVADPPVLVLDEATSSIDTRTEALVQSGMDRLMEGRTIFVIAHRLSTVQNSDAIMVLDQGNIIERGDHDALVAQKGVYYRLYTGDFELE